ncbi:unnamed protein product [Closterium sp. NIES-64]|nr:unnamed protein product [Closterium sp. NIES-64]
MVTIWALAGGFADESAASGVSAAMAAHAAASVADVAVSPSGGRKHMEMVGGDEFLIVVESTVVPASEELSARATDHSGLSQSAYFSPAVVDALAALEGEGEEKRGRTGEKEQWSLAAEVLVNPASNGVIVATVGAGAAVEETGSAGSALAAGGEDPAAMDGTTTAAATAAGSSGGRLANGEKQEEGSGQAGAAAAAGEASQAWQGLMDAQVDVMSVSRPLSSHPFLHATFTPSDYSTEFYIIRHGEAAHNVSPLIGGRSHDAPLTALGQQQAKLLGAYLREYAGLRFDAIFSSPIERSKQTAILVCQEIGEVESRIQYSDELQELSQGTWERQPRRTIYQQGVLEQMTAAQPDFRAPGGESQRQVEFRMVEFINMFSHGTAIRCLLRGLLGSNPHLTQNIGIDNTSITLLKHTPKKGWHLVKTNDTAHLIIAKGPLSAQQAC